MNKKTLWIIIAAALVAIAAAVLLLTGGRSGGGTYEELLANTEFEALDAAGLPSQWYTDAWIATPGYTEYSAENGVVTIVNHAANDARFAQIVSVSPNTMYRLTARVKADCAGGYGANVSVEGVNALSDAVYDTGGEWREIALYGQTGESQTRLTVFARLGGYSGEATGEATFDSVSLMRVDSVPSGYALQKLYQVASAQPASDEPSPAWRWLLPVALAACAVCAFLARYMDGMREMKALDDKRERAVPFALGALLLVALGLRLLIAGTIPGYDVDIGCFRGWASAMGAGGPANFYLGAGHSDYPPAYMLVLWLVDALSGGAGASELAVKLPPILCDIGIALTLYYIGKRYLPATAAAALSMLFAFSPMAFATSAAWGQTDSVLTLLILLTVLFAADGKWRFALPVYMLSVLMKPQALMFGPLGLMALICELVWHFDKKTLRDMLIGLGAALVLAIAVIAPFSVNMGGVGWLLELYGDTMGQYGYASVNGCNLYFLFGKNWTPAGTLAPFGLRFTAICLFLPALGWLVWRAKGDYKKLLDLRAPAPYIALCVLAQIALLPVAMTYGAYSALMLCVCVVCAAAVYFRGRSIRHLPFMGGVLLLAMFVLGGMMHERYLFAAVPLFLVAYALEKDRRALWLAILLMATVFLNVSLVLDRNIRIGGAAAHLQAPVAGIESDSAALEYLLSALNCAALAYALYLSGAVTDPDRAPLPPLSAAREAPTRQDAPLESHAARTLRNPPETRRMDKKDWLIMLTATALYAVLALVNLGATQAPQTSWTAHEWDEQVVLDLGETRRFRALYYGGIHWPQNSEFTLQTSEDGAYYGEAYYACLTDGDCYQWKYVVETAGEPGAISYLAATREMQGRYILLTAKDIGIDIWEIQFRDADTGEVLPVSLVLEEGVEALEDAQALIDEQTVMTDEPSWFNSMYFDVPRAHGLRASARAAHLRDFAPAAWQGVHQLGDRHLRHDAVRLALRGRALRRVDAAGHVYAGQTSDKTPAACRDADAAAGAGLHALHADAHRHHRQLRGAVHHPCVLLHVPVRIDGLFRRALLENARAAGAVGAVFRAGGRQQMDGLLRGRWAGGRLLLVDVQALARGRLRARDARAKG